MADLKATLDYLMEKLVDFRSEMDKKGVDYTKDESYIFYTELGEKVFQEFHSRLRKLE